MTQADLFPFQSSFNVYWRDKPYTPSHQVTIENVLDHEEAVLLAKEGLVEMKTGYTDPVLVAINGGKK